jgi:hypothetical protein
MITQAQIEAAAKAVREVNVCGLTINNQRVFCNDPRLSEREQTCACLLAAEAALTAAAQVGTFEAGPDECDTGVALTKAIDAVLAEDTPLVNHTIERCAQVAERMAWSNKNTQHLGPEQNCVAVAAAIRKLKYHEPGADRPSREDVEQRL